MPEDGKYVLCSQTFFHLDYNIHYRNSDAEISEGSGYSFLLQSKQQELGGLWEAAANSFQKINDIGTSTQQCFHLNPSCLSLTAWSAEQSGPAIDIQKRLINRHSAYNTACHASYERPSEPLIMFTVRSLGLLGTSAVLPFICLYAQALLVLSTHRGFQNQYLWNPTSFCLLRKLKDKKATRAGLLKCITQCSERKRKAGLQLKAGFGVRIIFAYAESIKEKNTIL